MKAIVTDHRILAGMERAGFIVRDGKPGDTVRHWTGKRVKVITVKEVKKIQFQYKGNTYRIKYFDGCFSPFVVRVGSGVEYPSFV